MTRSVAMLIAPPNLPSSMKMAVVRAPPQAPLAELCAQLGEEEQRYLEQLTSSARALDFVLGRLAAHEALLALGAHEEVARDPASRSPRWPEGIIGSIAHTRNGGDAVAVSCVQRSESTGCLGVDIEHLERRVTPGLADRIMTSGERASSVGSPITPYVLLRTFCAKEALYKAYSAHAAHALHFHHAEILFQSTGDRFTGTLDLGARTTAVSGSFHTADGYLIAWAAGEVSRGPAGAD